MYIPKNSLEYVAQMREIASFHGNNADKVVP